MFGNYTPFPLEFSYICRIPLTPSCFHTTFASIALSHRPSCPLASLWPSMMDQDMRTGARAPRSKNFSSDCDSPFSWLISLLQYYFIQSHADMLCFIWMRIYNAFSEAILTGCSYWMSTVYLIRDLLLITIKLWKKDFCIKLQSL